MQVNINDFLSLENTFYYENDDYVYIGSGELIEADKIDTLEENLNIIVNECPESLTFVGGFFGIFSYDLVKTLEKLPQENKATIGNKNIIGLIVKTFLVIDKLSNEKSIYSLNHSTTQGENNASKAINLFYKQLNQLKSLSKDNELNEIKVKSNTSKKEFMEKVNHAKEYIKNGDIFQVVLSKRFEVELNMKATELFEKIPHEESTFKFYFNLKDIQVLGQSPEILVKREGHRVRTNPIAGTRKRGKTKAEEIFLEKDLLSDLKEKAEHTMLVDLARNDMGKIADIGSIEVKNFMSIKRYRNVIHLTSEVIGKTSKNNIEILKTFLPAGTLTGAPKIRAMEIIESLEEDKREIYGGAIGYLSFNENMETAITIRSMVVKNNKAYIQAGAGIVYDSKPEREYEEIEEKASQLLELVKGAKNDFVN